MVAFDVQVELPLDAAAYLREKDSEAYKRFHADAMGTLEQEFLSSEIVDGEAVTVTRTVPTIDIPWALRRAILGNRRAEFVDTRRWTHGAHLTPPFSQRFHITNNITDRCVVTGVIVVDDAPGAPGACSVRARGEAVVTLKGLGPAVEKLVVSNLRASYDRLPGIVEDWMATRSARQGAAPEEASVSHTDSVGLRAGGLARGPSPGRLGRRARRDSARRMGAFGSVIDVADLDLEAGAGVGSGAAYEDDEFKSPEAKARAGRAAGGGFVSRGRSLLFSALGSGGGTAPPRRSLRHRQAAASRRRRRPDRARRTVCGLRRSTSLSLACVAACLFVVYAFVSGASLFANLSDKQAGFTRVVTPRQEAAMEAAEDAEASVFDAVEHMADDIERSRQGALAAAADDIERAARLKHLRAGEDSFRETDAAASLEGQRACVDAREEECARWACAGECDANPGFMITECACACVAAARDAAAAAGGRASETFSGDVRGLNAFAFLVSWSEFSEEGRHARTDTGSASSDASSETLVRGEKRREARVRVRLHADADAPRTLRALRGALGGGRCATGSFCGGGGACHFHRAELEYGLVQGTLPGLGEAGGAFGEPRLEGTSSWARGTVGYIPGGDNVLVATKPHPEWDAGFVAFGEVFEEDMAHIDALAGLPTEPFTHPEYKTVMAMLKRNVRFALEPA